MDADELQWKGQYWGRNGALKQGLRILLSRIRDKQERYEAMSALSSLYYSAAGNALKVQYRAHEGLRKLWWLIRGWWYLERALRWSNKLWRTKSSSYATPAMCDVRQAICLTAAQLPWHDRMLREAEAAIDLGLTLIRHSPKQVLHTHQLLLIGRAQVLLLKESPVEETHLVLDYAKERADHTVPRLTDAMTAENAVAEKRQYARVYRHLSSLYVQIGRTRDSEYCRETAARLAGEVGADDQLAKMHI